MFYWMKKRLIRSHINQLKPRYADLTTVISQNHHELDLSITLDYNCCKDQISDAEQCTNKWIHDPNHSDVFGNVSIQGLEN